MVKFKALKRKVYVKLLHFLIGQLGELDATITVVIENECGGRHVCRHRTKARLNEDGEVIVAARLRDLMQFTIRMRR